MTLKFEHEWVAVLRCDAVRNEGVECHGNVSAAAVTKRAAEREVRARAFNAGWTLHEGHWCYSCSERRYALRAERDAAESYAPLVRGARDPKTMAGRKGARPTVARFRFKPRTGLRGEE
jgi:hypothetical protein